MALSTGLYCGSRITIASFAKSLALVACCARFVTSFQGLPGLGRRQAESVPQADCSIGNASSAR